jgi:hypothetical protein
VTHERLADVLLVRRVTVEDAVVRDQSQRGLGQEHLVAKLHWPIGLAALDQVGVLRDAGSFDITHYARARSRSKALHTEFPVRFGRDVTSCGTA